MAAAQCDDLAVRAIRRVRAAYPSQRILLFSDDSDDPRFDALAREVAAEMHRSGPLYAQAAGARHWRLFFERAVDGACDVLFKIDPDTWVRRAFRALPDPTEALLFGTPVVDPHFIDRPHIQGGCVGITRAAIDQIASSGVLMDEGYTRADYASAVTIHLKHIEHRERTGRLSTDLILADLAHRLGIPMLRHPEVHSLWLRAADERAWDARGLSEAVNSPEDAFAVTHPHKL